MSESLINVEAGTEKGGETCALGIPGCVRPGKNTNFFVNGVLHVLILLMIVSSFFFLYVSQLSKDKFEDELRDMINNNLGNAIQTADTKQDLKNMLKQMPMDTVVNYYENKVDPASDLQNQWLKRTIVMIIIALFITVVGTLVILKLSCHQSVPFWSILKENIIMFALVGCVEIAFFMYIARNFVPTKPSLMMQAIVDSMKRNLS